MLRLIESRACSGVYAFDFCAPMPDFAFNTLKNFFHSFRAGPLQHLSWLETAYQKTLSSPSSDTLSIMDTLWRAEKAFRYLHFYVVSLQRNASENSPEGRRVFQDYLDRIGAIHGNVYRWFALYCDLRWPQEGVLPGVKRKNRVAFRERMASEAQALWGLLAQHAQCGVWVHPRERDIYLLKQRLERMEVNTGAWRVIFQQLCVLVYRHLRCICADARYAIRNRFQITLTQESLTSAQGDFADRAGPSGMGGEAWTRRLMHLEDWVHGYYPSWASLKAMYERCVGPLIQFLQRCRGNRMRKITAAGLALVMIFGIVAFALRQTDMDNRLWRVMIFELKQLIHSDPESLADKQKKEYFRTHIARVDELYSPEKIRTHIKVFYRKGLYRYQGGFLFFCRFVLKEFFMLLAERKVDDQLKQEVVEAAFYLDGRIARSIAHIVSLYDQPMIREGELREQILQLRRAFVDYNVFPFTFIVLEDDVPYLFLFSETVIKKYVLAKEAFQRMHLDGNLYSNAALWPGVAYIVEGEEYPFRDRPGYFEGEFAVVFRRFAPEVLWTVYHEVGHVVDHLRFLFERKLYPDNVELHAMLAPVMWAEDRKAYVERRLVDEALKGDEFDNYSQAAKGILNGILLYLSEKDPQLKQPLISNRFEADRIRRIAGLAGTMDPEDLHEAAYVFYRDPQKYLSTAEPGRYVAYLQNYQEIIAGTDHKIAQRGFILGGGGLIGSRNGPRLVFDGTDEDSLGKDFNVWLFLRNAVSLIFYPSNNLPQATSAESIAAAVIVFIFFNSAALLIHALAAPYRKRMFYGWALDKGVDRIYDRNPWSRGISYGPEQRERKLLKRIFSSGEDLDPQLKKDIVSFKSTANEQERMVFDICLFLSPLNPRQSAIVNKAHDLLFFLPFLGPYLGRAVWLWPVQSFFHQRERYNDRIESLLSGAGTGLGFPGMLPAALQDLMREFELPARTGTGGGVLKIEDVLASLRSLVLEALRKESSVTHMNFDFIRDKMPENQEPSVEFDRIEEYMPGDDIRHIDWKATARYATAMPMVRRFSNPYGVRVALWLDMRFLRDEDGRRRWAVDFARSVRMFHLFRSETICERIILIGPGGRMEEMPVFFSAERECLSLALKIFEKIRQKYEEGFSRQMVLDIAGLAFYTEEENRRFLQQAGLSDFLEGGAVQEIRRTPLREKRMNIFVVGAKMSEKNLIETLAGEENKVFYW